MKKISMRLSAVIALELAAEQAGIELADVQNVDLKVDPSGFYCITFLDNWMNYVCYIDTCTGEVCGFLSEPLDN